MPDRIQLKQSAKLIMKERPRAVYITSAAYVLIASVINTLTTRVTGADKLNDGIYGALTRANSIVKSMPSAARGGEYLSDGLPAIYDEFYDKLAEFRDGLTPFAGILSLALSILLAVIIFGYIMANIKMSRRQDAGVKTLFDGFALTGKIIWLNIVSGFFVFLWSLLLIVPGFIAAYRYRLAAYVLADDPSKGALDCIRESKRLMHSHKMELFVTDLSFIGWTFVGSFISTLLGLLTGVMLSVFAIWLLPYMYLTYAGFYNKLADCG